MRAPDKATRILNRALEELHEQEREAEDERFRERDNQVRADQKAMEERELQAIERIAISLQQIGEAMSRISTSGIHVYGSR